MKRMDLVQRVSRREDFLMPKSMKNPSIDDRYAMDYMGSAEYEFGALPNSLKRICKNFRFFSVFSIDKIKDSKGNSLVLFIQEGKQDEYIKEIEAFLRGERHLKEHIDLEYHIKGKDWRGKPLEEINDIWWDIVNDAWFTFIPGEINLVKMSIFNTIEKKKLEGKTEWY
jgi:hypothetical protein